MSELHEKFGELLKLERKRKGLKLEELSEQLKITEANLGFIEEGDVASLPSMIYYNLFAKAYAEHLGIDYQRTVEAIKEDLGEDVENNNSGKEVLPTKDKQAKTDREPQAEEKADENGLSIKKLLYIFGGIVAIFVVFMVAYLVFFSSDSDGTDQHPSQTPVAEVPVAEADKPGQAEDRGELDWSVSEYAEPQKMTLRLIPRNQSWSTVLADGDTAIFRNLIPGRVYDVEAMYRMTVSVGIPSQVDVELNGQPVNLRDSVSGRISRVEINQLNLEEILGRDTETSPVSAPATSTSSLNQQTNPAEGNNSRASDTQTPADSVGDTSADRNGDDET